MRAIVTGVAGFIGSHVARCLQETGWNVVGIDDLSGGDLRNVPEGVRFAKLDCGEPLDELMRTTQPRAVFHLAAYAAEGLSHHIPLFNYRNNVLATVNVLAAAQRVGVEHFVFTSSIAAYGHPHRTQSFLESDPCVPCDPYGVAKLACEQHIQAVTEYFGAPTFTIFRPHNVYGTHQNLADPYRNVVGIFIRRALRGEALPVFGDGLQTRSFSHVNAVARAIASCVDNQAARNQVFNVGGDVATTIMDLAQLVSEVVGVPLRLEHLPPRKEVIHAHADHTKSQQAFPDIFPDRTELRFGIAEMVAWARGIPIAEPTPCPAPIELWDGLPPSWRESSPPRPDEGNAGAS